MLHRDKRGDSSARYFVGCKPVHLWFRKLWKLVVANIALIYKKGVCAVRRSVETGFDALSAGDTWLETWVVFQSFSETPVEDRIAKYCLKVHLKYSSYKFRAVMLMHLFMTSVQSGKLCLQWSYVAMLKSSSEYCLALTQKHTAHFQNSITFTYMGKV